MCIVQQTLLRSEIPGTRHRMIDQIMKRFLERHFVMRMHYESFCSVYQILNRQTFLRHFLAAELINLPHW